MISARIGLFETNSSSCHACSVVNTVELQDWMDGKLVAHAKRLDETKISSGNFWSRQWEFEFAPAEKAEKLNYQIVCERYKNSPKAWALFEEKKVIRCAEEFYVTFDEFTSNGFTGEIYSPYIHYAKFNGEKFAIVGLYYHS